MNQRDDLDNVSRGTFTFLFAATVLTIVFLGLFLIGCSQFVARNSQPDARNDRSANQNIEQEESRDVSNLGSETPSGYIPDMLYENERDELDLTFAIIDGKARLLDNGNIEIPLSQPLKEGGIYSGRGKGTVLNGGVVGYSNTVTKVTSVDDISEISLESLNLKYISNCPYPQTAMLGDYADGDFILVYGCQAAVWKGGDWIYRYSHADDDVMQHATLFFGDNISYEQIAEGFAKGIVASPEYFVWCGAVVDTPLSMIQFLADSSPLVIQPVFLPTKITDIESNGVVTCSETFWYDEHGNALRAVRETSNSYIERTYEDYDACGYPHRIRSAQDGRVYEYSFEDSGLASSVKIKGEPAGYLEKRTYYPDGTSASYSNEVSTMEFDASGRLVSCTSASNPQNSFQVTWIDDPATGYPIGCEQVYDESRKSYHVLTSDEHGNIISMRKEDGSVRNVEYIYIETPSLYAMNRGKTQNIFVESKLRL